MREPISLKDIFAIIVRKGNVIVCMALVFAVLAGCYGFVGGMTQAGKQEGAPEQWEQEHQAELEAYQEELQFLQDDLENVKKQQKRREEYCKDSIVMQVDPYALAKSVTVFAVVGTEDSSQYKGSETMTDYAYVISAIQYYYQLYWNTSDLGELLAEATESPMKDPYLREIVSLEVMESGALMLTVYGRTQDEAALLAEAACGSLLDMHDVVCEKTYPHEISVFNQIVEDTANDVFAEHQKKMNNELLAYRDEIAGLEAQIAALEALRPSNGYTMAGVAVSTVKWAVIGAAAGVFLGCVWVLVLFLLRSRVESSRQMEQVLGIAFLGSVAGKGNVWNRLAGKIMGERQWKDLPEAAAYVSENLKASVGSGSGVAIVSTLDTKDAQSVLQRVEEAAASACGKVCCVSNGENNAQTIGALRECQYLVLAERIGVSDVPKMLAVLDMAKRIGIQIAGFVTV